MKIQWKTLLVCILIPLAIGGLSAFVTRSGMEAFAQVNKPALAPPDWLFPIVWTILYVLMGIASYLVYTSDLPVRTALTVYAIQLIFNFMWFIFFFNMQWYLFAFFIATVNITLSYSVTDQSTTDRVDISDFWQKFHFIILSNSSNITFVQQ